MPYIKRKWKEVSSNKIIYLNDDSRQNRELNEVYETLKNMALNQWTVNPINFNIKSIENNHSEENNENALVCLRIARFSKVPKIDFQKVKINKSKTLRFEVFNPNSFATLIYFQDFNNSDFSLEILNVSPQKQNPDEGFDGTPLALEPDQVKIVCVRWTPTSPGNTREVLTVKWDGGLKLQVIFLGNCIGELSKKSNLKNVKKVKKLSFSYFLTFIDALSRDNLCMNNLSDYNNITKAFSCLKLCSYKRNKDIF